VPNTKSAALATITSQYTDEELIEIVEAGRDALQSRRYFEFSETGVEVRGEPPFEAWAATIAALQVTATSLPLWAGDLLNYGEAKYGQKYSQFLDADIATYGTLRNWAWVTNKVPKERRIEGLTFTHYARVASLPAREQTAYLTKAADEELSASALEKLVRQKHQLPGPPPPPEVLWEGVGLIRQTEEGLACILSFQGDLEVGQEVSAVLTSLKRVR